MIKTSTIFYFPEIKQDTLVRPQQRQSQPSLNLTVRKPLLDLERAEEVIKQFEQREQEIIESQRPVIRPKAVPRLREPSIEVDSLMAKYQYIGCSPRANFPDTFALTVLERYYQPMTLITVPPTVADPPVETTTSELPQSNPQTVTYEETAIITDTSQGFASNPISSGFPSSVTLFLIFCLILLSAIKTNFGKNFTDTIRSFFSFRRTLRLFEEHRDSNRQATLLSNIFFALTGGIFISVVLPFFGASPLWDNYTLSILFFSMATGLLFIIKAWIWQVLGTVFMVQPISRLYIYNMFLFNSNIGLFIFPLVAIIPYITVTLLPFIVYSVLIVIVITYLYKLWRIFQIIHGQNVPIFYFISYLCTLEILPLLLFIKGCKVLVKCIVI